MEFSLHSLHRVDADLETVLKSMREHLNVTDIEKVKQTMLARQNKDVLVGFVEGLLRVVSGSQQMLRSAAEQIDALKSENMQLQNNVIGLQNEVTQKTSDDLQSVTSTVAAEMKTWAGVVAESCRNSVSPLKIKEAVKSAVIEEDRSQNFLVVQILIYIALFLVYGVEENADDDQILKDVLQQIDAKPEVVEHYRIGMLKERRNRPIKVRLKRQGAVRDVLRNAKKLKEAEKLASIFISPDRSEEERLAHKQLIDEMRRMRNEDSTKYFFIRRGAVCSTERKSDSLKQTGSSAEQTDGNSAKSKSSTTGRPGSLHNTYRYHHLS